MSVPPPRLSRVVPDGIRKPGVRSNTVTTVRPTHLVDRAGVARTSYLVTTQLGWLFREQETSDVGVDAHLEVVTGASLAAKTTGGATGRLLAVQIKSGESQFATASEGGWWFPCDAAHVAYWENHSLPVTVMLFDPETERVHWQHVNADTLVSTGKHYKVFVPAHQQIDDANAEALSCPAQPEQGADPLQVAVDRLPSDARIRLLRDHRADADYALPLALFLADADDPARAVTELLTQPPNWLACLQPRHEEGAWKAVAAYACAHELGLIATDALERAAATAPDDGHLLALAAVTAVAYAPDRARILAAAAEEAGATLLVSAARALIDTGGYHPAHLPDIVARSLAAGDPAAARDVNVLRFAAYCHFAGDRHDDGEDMLERALRIAPDEPSLQLDLARCLLRRSATGTARQASFDTGRAQRLANAARAGYRRWHGPSTSAAVVLLEARLMAEDVIAAIHTAIAEPEGEAQEPETTCEPLQLEAARLAYKAGRPDLVETIATGLTSDGAKLQLDAFAADADPGSSRESRIAAWEAAAVSATDDDQRGIAAFALSGLGVWPVPYLDEARERGVIPEAIYQTRRAAAEAAQGATEAAIRRLRAWENSSAVAAMGLVELYEREGHLVLAAEAAERAGLRFGDTRPRVLAVELWDRSGATEQARLRALTLLSRPFLPTSMRRHLRGLAVQWANDRSDWSDMEEHALVGLAEAVGIEHITALEGAAGVLPQTALPFAWAAIRAQLNGRNPEAARDTLNRFAPQIRNADDARSWLMLVGWSGWTETLAETAIGLAEHYRSEDAELTGAILAGLLFATAEPSQDDTTPSCTAVSEAESRATARRLVLPEALRMRLRALLADPPASKALTMVPGDAEDLVRRVEQDLGPREALLDAAADAVRCGAVPMGMLAWAAGRPVALAFAQRAPGFIPASSINDTHVAAEIKAVRDALNRTAVLDVSALAVVSLISDRFDQLRAVFAATPTTTAVYDDIIRTRYALNEMLLSSGQLGVRGGRFTISEYSDQDKEHLAHQAAAFSQIIPSLRPVEVPDLAGIRGRLCIASAPDEADTAWLSAAQHALDTDAALWCDDAALRDLLIRAGIPTFGTVALLHVLKELSAYPEFTDERHNRDIHSLFKACVVDLPIALADIAEVAAAKGWQPVGAAILFARPQLWAIDASRPLWAEVAEKVWDNAPDQLGGWFEVAAVGVSTWREPEAVPQAVVQLAAETLVAIGVGPDVADSLLCALPGAIESCSQAATRRRNLSRQPVAAPQVPARSVLPVLLRRAVIGQLTSHHGFAGAAAVAIVNAALPHPTDADEA
ncbi:DUF4365 domain-containing protein [Streptomyces caeni]|uniref:DUF4365 domain-containing protein n=1 Tax=Streptomyces caeni TaxID=2307231 RepID=A0ABW4ITM5_9ACTN